MNEKNSRLYLWEERTLFVGKIDRTLDVRPIASSLLWCLEGYIEIYCTKHKAWRKCQTALLDSCNEVKIKCRGATFANISLDIAGRDYDGLKRLFQTRSEGFAYSKNRITELDIKLSFLYLGQSSCAELAIQTNAAMRSFHTLDFCVDARVIKVIARINIDHNINTEVAVLAAIANVSIPHLHRIFKAQTGITLLKYRTCRRFVTVASMISRGMNITEAALLAGFSDCSHYIHAHKETYGETPTFFFSNLEKNIETYFEDEDIKRKLA